MKNRRNQNIKALILLIFYFSVTNFYAQNVKLINPSFEDRPHFGTIEDGYPTVIKDWYDCAVINRFYNETPPDIHEGGNRDTAFWENTLESAHGNTYLGLVVRDNETWEAVSQRLALPLRKGKCYMFSIYLARSDNYWSFAKVAKDKKQNFVKPAVFQLLGGTGRCGDREVLAVSEPVNNASWEEHTLFIEPQTDYNYVTLQAFYETPVLFPYNGHILVDGASDFDLIECGEEEVAIYERQKRENSILTKKMPAHKAKSRRTEVFNRGSRENKVDTITYVRPNSEKILVNLERDKLSKGAKVKIDKLYFEADTTSIGIDSYSVLNEVFDFLNTNPDIVVEIGGHTNGIPSHTYCDKLSTERAEAVANYLIGKGIQSKRVLYKGYGKRKPIASNSTDEGRKKNQRVEIKIVSMNS